MPVLHAIVLGIVQGLSEFLPISSSGHLILVPWLFGWTELTTNPELEKTFDVALHIGTLAGTLAYFRSDVARLARAGLGAAARRVVRRPTAVAAPGTGARAAAQHAAGTSADERLAWLLVLSSLPAAATGALLQRVIVERLGAEWLIGTMLVVFGLLLQAADRLAGFRKADEYRVRDALLMGAAQAAALSPGVSRSGATMTMGRFLGFERDAAARLSFLMSLPVTGGAVAYSMAGLVADGGIPPGFGPAFFWGILASGVSGFFVVSVLLRYLRTRSFAPFVTYRVVAGLAVIALAASGLR